MLLVIYTVSPSKCILQKTNCGKTGQENLFQSAVLSASKLKRKGGRIPPLNCVNDGDDEQEFSPFFRSLLLQL